MANKQTYEIDLKVDGLISNFKRAINVMRQEGASNNTLAPLEKSLASIEHKLQDLSVQGKKGFTNPKEIATYEKAVNQVYFRLERLGQAFSQTAADSTRFTNSVENLNQRIEETRRVAEKARQGLSEAFGRAGFSNEQSRALSESVQTEDELIQRLKEELTIRQANLRQIRAQAAEEQRVIGQQYGAKARSILTPRSISAGTFTQAGLQGFYSELDRRVMSGDYTADMTTLLQEINTEISRSISNVNIGFNTIWDNFTQRLRDITGLTEGEVIANLDVIRAKIQGIVEKRDEALSKNLATQQTGELTNNIRNFQTIIEETQTGTGQLAQSFQNAQTASQAYTNTVNQMSAAEADNARRTQTLAEATNNLTNSVQRSVVENTKNITTLNQTASSARKTSDQFEMLKNHVLMFLSVTSVISIFRQQIRKTFEDVKTLDKSFASIAMVTTKSVNDMWHEYANYANMAAELGQRTQSVIDASGLFYQQGLDTAEALELTRDTMKLATLAGIDYTQATDEMTAAIRGFRMEMNQGSHVTDVYSTLAANAAASVNEIAQAMVRTSSIANSAGMSFENTAAFLTQMIETTQESAENIGTSMKTIIA